MSMHKTVILLVLSFGWGAALAADGQKFGQPVAPNDFAAWDISIGPDGVGLPAGSGSAVQGAAGVVRARVDEKLPHRPHAEASTNGHRG